MQQALLTLAGVCIAAAIVGGGLKAFKVEIPALRSLVRQVLLGIFGVLVGAFALCCVAGPARPFGPLSDDSALSDDGPTPTDEEPTPTDEEPTPTERRDPSPLSAGSGSGSVPPCDRITIEVRLLELSGGDATFRVEVTNNNPHSVDLPPLRSGSDKGVMFVDASRTQWHPQQPQGWGGFGPGATVDAEARLTEEALRFDAPRDSPHTGHMNVRGIVEDSMSPQATPCGIEVPLSEE